MSSPRVHQNHCCLLHGCKYGVDRHCHVVTGDVVQLYACEQCTEGEAEFLGGAYGFAIVRTMVPTTGISLPDGITVGLDYLRSLASGKVPDMCTKDAAAMVTAGLIFGPEHELAGMVTPRLVALLRSLRHTT